MPDARMRGAMIGRVQEARRLQSTLEASFETQPSAAPQDEVGGWKRRC
jgi:hypothetical protein